MHPRDSRHSKHSSKSAQTRRGQRGKRPEDPNQGPRAFFAAVGLCIAVGGAVAAWLGIGRSRQEAKARAAGRSHSDPTSRASAAAKPSAAKAPASKTPAGKAPAAKAPAAKGPSAKASAPASALDAPSAPDGTTYGPNGSSGHEAEASDESKATTPSATPDDDANLPHTPSAPDEAPTTVFHLVPGDTGWQLKREGEATPIEFFPTKKAGLDAARRMAREREPSRLVVHRVDGTIQNQFSYGDR